jgi:uncharacterized protein YqgC (DUF456 family)
VDYLILSALVLLSVCGIALAVLQLPGTWLIIASAVGYDWYYDWQRIGWVWLASLAVFALIAEVFDSLAGVVAARKAGASRRAAIGALVGGIVGMIVIGIPVPVLGTVVGGLLGCFGGALVAELSLRKNLVTGAKVGLFATIGRLVGIVAKTSASLIIAGTVVSRAAWSTW